MGLRDMLRAVREYPDACTSLRQARAALKESEKENRSLVLKTSEQSQRLKLLTNQTAALQAALTEYCPQIFSVEEMKRLYKALAPNLDSKGFLLYHMAEQLTGIDIHTFFSYEDNRGLFEGADSRRLLNYLTAAHFHAVDWNVVPGTTYESATLRKVDTSTPEYQTFERQLYEKVLERLGFGDMLSPEQKVRAVETGLTELKLYSPLSGELTSPEDDRPQVLDGSDLILFQDVILRGIMDEQMPEEEKQGLMAYFDGSDAVSEKVVSLFPSVEKIDGRTYAVAVCQIAAPLSPEEMQELKEYCRSQYNDAWGEGFAQRPRHTEYGDLYVSFYTDHSASILTKEEMDAPSTPSRSPHQLKRGGDAR